MTVALTRSIGAFVEGLAFEHLPPAAVAIATTGFTDCVACGLAASFAHIVFGPGSNVPAVGASGAISGVLGGYLILFPRNQVRVLTRGGVAHVPAIVVLGLWIFIQFINGIGALSATTETGGVAYMAHIGGFVAGLVLVKLMAARRPVLA